MLSEDGKRRALAYIQERRCKNGGFCFYRLEEPSGADTFYAVASLHLMGVRFPISSTTRYLRQFQRRDGSFRNIYEAFFVLKGLWYLRQPPTYPSHHYLKSLLKFPPGSSSLGVPLKRLYYIVDLADTYHVPVSPPFKEEILSFVLSLENENGGFGRPVPSLISTAYALHILSLLRHPIHTMKTPSFLHACEHPLHGFVNVPKTAPSFLEHVHAGLLLCLLLKRIPRYLPACTHFIHRCQDRNGGFGRAPGGLPTLQDTWIALHALKIIQNLSC